MGAITEGMVKQTYSIARKVYAGQISLQNGVNTLNDTYKMNRNSAMMYINDFKCLLNGQGYQRIMAVDDTHYFLTMIEKDYGNDALKKALNAVRLHIKYAKSKGIISNVEKLYNELIQKHNFSGQIGETSEEGGCEIPTDDEPTTAETTDTAIIQNFTYEKDLQNSLAYQAESLFPGYKIYGNNLDGMEYQIGGKRIDLLLENKNENKLLVIELKADVADFKAYGQICMYFGLLKKQFPNKEINGIIIAGEIDESLRNAASISDKIKLMTYKMELTLCNA
jgi:hypothetical protein